MLKNSKLWLLYNIWWVRVKGIVNEGLGWESKFKGRYIWEIDVEKMKVRIRCRIRLKKLKIKLKLVNVL